MTTANDLITEAYRDIGKLGQGRTLSSALASQGLTALNQMLSSWSNDVARIVAMTSEDLAIGSSAISYTIGSGGDFNTTRPEAILLAYYSLNGVDYPLVPFSKDEYNNITSKNSAGIPEQFHYEPAYPLGTIYFDYKLDTSATLHLDSQKALTSFSALTTTVSLPAGYEEAIRYNLAIRLAPGNGKVPSPLIMQLAADGLSMIENNHISQSVPTAHTDFVRRGVYNVLSDR